MAPIEEYLSSPGITVVREFVSHQEVITSVLSVSPKIVCSCLCSSSLPHVLPC